MSDKMAFMQGAKVYLRPLERADLNETYLGWLNDPEVTRYLETGSFPCTAHDLEKFYQGVTGTKTEVIFAVADRESHTHIGNVKLGPINWVHRRAMFGIMIGEKGFWGKGVGEEATRLIVEYGFFRLNLHRVGLGVYEEHRSAIRCYEKIGFKVEGCLRDQMFQDGKYKNQLWMGLLRTEYKPPKAGKGK
ncbi:MAG TPA: GNAT family protein [Terriglobales bacterium]|jgi:ribosomal-protein-alanine N-acetyltransferase|nr:GNAT family protein [Terriglobales bacterium]